MFFLYCLFLQHDNVDEYNVYIGFRQVHLGKDPVSEFTRRQIAEEREIALHEYMVRFSLQWPLLFLQMVVIQTPAHRLGTTSFVNFVKLFKIFLVDVLLLTLHSLGETDLALHFI